MGKLKNKRLADLSDDDRKKWAEFYAREAAKEALYEWYETAHVCANAEIRHLQITSWINTRHLNYVICSVLLYRR